MTYLAAAGFLFLALLHLPPAMAAVVPGMIERLYGADAAASGLGILLRHRAVMFGLIVVACAVAAAWPPARAAALVLAAWSLLGFLVVYWLGGHPAGALQRLAVFDLAALPVLAFLAYALLRGA